MIEQNEFNSNVIIIYVWGICTKIEQTVLFYCFKKKFYEINYNFLIFILPSFQNINKILKCFNFLR